MDGGVLPASAQSVTYGLRAGGTFASFRGDEQQLTAVEKESPESTAELGRREVQQPSAPTPAPAHRYGWASGGLGGGRTGLGPSLAVGVPLTEHMFLGGRYVHTEELVFFSSPAPTTWDIGPLIGVLAQGRYGQFSVASGLVAVGGRRRAEQKSGTGDPGCTFFCSIEYEMRPVRAVGVPVDIQAFFTPIRYLGVGVHGYATVSPGQNLLGASLQLQVRIPR